MAHARVPLAAVLLVCAAAPARADVRSWTLCTPGSLRSCHSVSIGTAPVYSGVTQVGTAITVKLANLQGSGLAGIGTQASGLYQVYFTGPIATGVPVTTVNQSATMTGPGASGTLPWQRITVYPLGGLAWIELRGAGANPALLGGCTTAPMSTGTITASTCGTAAFAVFTFTLNAVIDANQFNNAEIFAYGAGGSETCASNPGATPFFAQGCDVLVDPLATPEASTMLLLSTGLLGLSLTAWRDARSRRARA